METIYGIDAHVMTCDEVVATKHEIYAMGLKNNMSLDISFNDGENTVAEANITHNLAEMASACDLYEVLWCPEENGYTVASDMYDILVHGLNELLKHPDYYKKYNPENGWGTYGGFLDVLYDLIRICQRHPNSTIEIWK